MRIIFFFFTFIRVLYDYNTWYVEFQKRDVGFSSHSACINITILHNCPTTITGRPPRIVNVYFVRPINGFHTYRYRKNADQWTLARLSRRTLSARKDRYKHIFPGLLFGRPFNTIGGDLALCTSPQKQLQKCFQFFFLFSLPPQRCSLYSSYPLTSQNI